MSKVFLTCTLLVISSTFKCYTEIKKVLLKCVTNHVHSCRRVTTQEIHLYTSVCNCMCLLFKKRCCLCSVRLFKWRWIQNALVIILSRNGLFPKAMGRSGTFYWCFLMYFYVIRFLFFYFPCCHMKVTLNWLEQFYHPSIVLFQCIDSVVHILKYGDTL